MLKRDELSVGQAIISRVYTKLGEHIEVILPRPFLQIYEEGIAENTVY